MRDGRADHRDMDQALAGRFHAFADRIRDGARLADAGADIAVAVADDDQDAPGHGAAALVGLLHFVGLDDALFQIERVRD